MIEKISFDTATEIPTAPATITAQLPPAVQQGAPLQSVRSGSGMPYVQDTLRDRAKSRSGIRSYPRLSLCAKNLSLRVRWEDVLAGEHRYIITNVPIPLLLLHTYTYYSIYLTHLTHKQKCAAVSNLRG
jgi:hypothetical protein